MKAALEETVSLTLLIGGGLLIALAFLSVAVPGLLPFAITPALQEVSEPPEGLKDWSKGYSYTTNGIFLPDGTVDRNYATPGSYISQSFIARKDYSITRADFAMNTIGGSTPFSLHVTLFPATGRVGIDARPDLEQPLATSESRKDIALTPETIWVSFLFSSSEQYRVRTGSAYAITLVQGDELPHGEYTEDQYAVPTDAGTYPNGTARNLHPGNPFHQHPPYAPEPVFGDIGIRIYGDESEPEPTTTTQDQTQPSIPSGPTPTVELFPLSAIQVGLFITGIGLMVTGAVLRKRSG